MYRRGILIGVMVFISAVFCFGQNESIRDYVGLISIRYHADVIQYMGKFRETFEKKGQPSAVRAIDNYLKGLSGSGFVYVAPDGANYILTNEHVVAQSDSLAVTMEKLDGAKITYERLKVLAVDEEKDLAILVFDEGVKPFTRGLSFSTVAVREGGDVYAAGFPGLGNQAIWQFSGGKITNAVARIPKSSDSDETIGPYIQHSAPIDPGNSGGPLLIETSGVPAGYSVIGINTMSATRRQATNFAIPVNQVSAFIEGTLNKGPVNEQELISRKVDDFVKGLRANKTVYNHIADYLSNTCTASNAEFAISELLDKATATVQRDFFETFSHDPVEGMNTAVAWLIENTMRGKSITIKITVDSITSNSRGFDVAFNVNDALVKTEWIKEYGVYRMETYGDKVSGNKTLLGDKEKKKAQDTSLRTDSFVSISGGYAYVDGYESAFHVSLILGNPFSIGFEVNIGLNGQEYFQAGASFGYTIPIRLNTFALMPFGEIGMGLLTTKESKKEKLDSLGNVDDSGFDQAIAITLTAGLMFTTAAVPGLFGRAYYQYCATFMPDKFDSIENHGVFGFSIGYGF
jgi:serine protease Do